MSRKSIDCRQLGGKGNCSLVISGLEEEVLDLAVIHGIVAHGHDDPYQLREQLRSMLVDMPETKTAVA